MENTITIQNNLLSDIETAIFELQKFLLNNKKDKRVSEEMIKFVNQLAEYLNNKDIRQSDWMLQKSVIVLLDVGLLEKVKADHVTPEETDHLVKQIKIICAFLRTDITSLISYKYVDCLEILAGTKNEFDQGSFLLALREFKDDKYGHEIAWQASDSKTWLLNLRKDHNWFDIAIHTVLLHITFKWFFMMPEDRQRNLLTSFFWQACHHGVPLRDNIGELLYETHSIGEYAIENQTLIRLIEENKEDVKYGEEGKKLGSFLSIAHEFYKQVTDPDTVEEQSLKYIQKICPMELKKTAFLNQLAEALSVYVRIKEGILIDHNMVGEPEGQNQFNREMAQLVVWFINEIDWSKIAAYFNDKQSMVSCQQFLKQYVSNINLEIDSEAVTKLLNFNEFLRSNKLISKDFELLNFHESDSQFHWNEELLS